MIYRERSTYNNWKKEDLIDVIICLQNNHKNQCQLNEHLLRTVNQCMYNNPDFSKEMGEVLEVWNKHNGTRYQEVKNDKK